MNKLSKHRKEIASALANVPDDELKSVLKEELSKGTKPASDEAVEEFFKQMMDASKEYEESQKSDKILNQLNVPCHNGLVQSTDLVKILMDEKKIKELLSRINMKAFW